MPGRVLTDQDVFGPVASMPTTWRVVDRVTTVPLDLLRSEQDRIARQVAFLDSRIEASSIEYEQARAHLDDSLRRIANQAFFERLTVTDAGGIDAEPGEPFNLLFGSTVHTTARVRQGTGGNQAGQTGNVASVNNHLLVGPTGIEPMTLAV